MATDTQVQTAIKSDVSWLKAHERIILLFIALVLGGWLGNKWMDNRITAAETQVAIVTQQLKTQEAINTQQTQQTKQDVAQYQAMVDTLTRQNAALASAVSTRNSQLVVQKQADATLTLPDLAVRWKNLSNLSDTEIQAAAGSISVTDSGALKTVSQLEEIPVIQADLVDTKTVADNTQKELDKSNQVIGDLTKQVSGLNLQVTDQDKQCKADLAEVKATARKSKRNWFVAGFVSGIATRLLLKF